MRFDAPALVPTCHQTRWACEAQDMKAAEYTIGIKVCPLTARKVLQLDSAVDGNVHAPWSIGVCMEVAPG